MFERQEPGPGAATLEIRDRPDLGPAGRDVQIRCPHRSTSGVGGAWGTVTPALIAQAAAMHAQGCPRCDLSAVLAHADMTVYADLVDRLPFSRAN
jgi:hypothetical protein